MKIRQKIKRIGAVMLALSMCVTMLTGCWLDPRFWRAMEMLGRELEEQIIAEMNDGIYPSAADGGRAYITSSGFDPIYDGTGFRHSMKENASKDDLPQYINKAGGDFSAISSVDLLNLLILEPRGVALNVLYKIQKNKETSPWPGYCNGVALLMALVYNGDLSLDSITDTDVECFSKLNPNTDSKFLSKILFYFYTQETLFRNTKLFPSANTQTLWEGITNSHPAKTDSSGHTTEQESERLRNFFEKVYSLMQDGKVGVLYGEYTKSDGTRGGHSVLVTGCFVEGEGDQKKYGLELFDINGVGPIMQHGFIEDMLIQGDYSSFTYPHRYTGINFTFDSYNWLKFVAPGRLSAIASAAGDDPYTAYALMNDPVSIAAEGDAGLAGLDAPGPVERIPDGHMWVSVPDGKPFELTAGDGKFLKFDGEELTGDMSVYNAYTSDDADGQTLHLETDKTDVLTATSLGETLSIDALDNDNYLSVSAENADSAALTLGEGIDIAGENFTFDAYISAEPSESGGTIDSVEDIGDGLVSVAAGAEKAVSLKAEGTDVKTTSDGELTDIAMARYRGTEKFERTMEKSSGTLSFSSRLDIRDRIRRFLKELFDRLKGARQYAGRKLREFLPESVLKIGEESQKERRLS